jgi:hypothetical protein
MNFLELLQNLGIYTLMIAGLSFLARSIVLQYFSKDLERFKSTLAMAAYEHQIRFSRLHEKRAKVIEETYANLVDLYDVSIRFLDRFPYKQREEATAIVQDVLKATSRFMTHFERHRIYFDSEVSGKIIRLNEAILDALNVPLGDAIGAPHVGECLSRDFINEMKDRIPPIKTDLENAFREILGVIRPKKDIDA